MVREEFLSLLTGNGIATLKEVRKLTLNKEEDEITEFELLDFPNFDETKFAKLCAEKFKLTFIDLKNAKVSKDTIKALRKKNVIKYRAIPIQISQSKVTLATFDPTIVQEASKRLSTEFKKNTKQ